MINDFLEYNVDLGAPFMINTSCVSLGSIEDHKTVVFLTTNLKSSFEQIYSERWKI